MKKIKPENNPLEVIKSFKVDSSEILFYSLQELEKKGWGNVNRMPLTIKILLEWIIRNFNNITVKEEHVTGLYKLFHNKQESIEIPFLPSRIIMQDFTGVPAIVDLAAMREAVKLSGGDPLRVNPVIPVDLIIDHSLQVDHYGTEKALHYNTEMELIRNRERYEFLRWGAETFENFRVIPPSCGIIHQVNLEYLADVVCLRKNSQKSIAYPDTLLGTDSHTTMINALGVLGWGVGGIEAEVAMLGKAVSIVISDIVGVKIKGKLKENVTATDMVLYVTEMMRKQGVVGKFIEFFGSGIDYLSVPDRATISNMTPEYGATASLFPVDDATLSYLHLTGRSKDKINLIEKYTKEQGFFRKSDSTPPVFEQIIELDLEEVEPSVAGPKRPQDRLSIKDVKEKIRKYFTFFKEVKQTEKVPENIQVEISGCRVKLENGSVVLASITSCTNTSNPDLLMAAALLARNAVKRGLRVSPHVKTSFTPGSRVSMRYLEKSVLLPYFEALGFHIVGYGCATCIGNSGPLNPGISETIRKHNLIVCSVTSGNRNFEGRIHTDVKANFLASPPLVVAYAIAGTMNIDLNSQPIGFDPNDNPVYLHEIWPSKKDVKKIVDKWVISEDFTEEYSRIFISNTEWNSIHFPAGNLFQWNPCSTYIRKPPFLELENLEKEPSLKDARVLALLGDSITTDHISPAGAIPIESPAGRWLLENGVEPSDFNTYGSRRGNHEVMVRGTFSNIRLKNKLVPKLEGGYTVYFPTGEILYIFDAAMRYREEKIPLIILAGKEYGTGSSRDWAAKGTALLGIRAVIAESFERIHRSNLVGMGVLPLQFMEGENITSLNLTGKEFYSIEKINSPAQKVRVSVKLEKGEEFFFNVLARIDTQQELEIYHNGGILRKVLKELINKNDL